MFRFVMPDHTLPVAKREQHLNEQMEAFLRSEALAELFELLHTDRSRLATDYNGRTKANGAVVEMQMVRPVGEFELLREKLYPLFGELGFLSINQPLSQANSRILVLAGAFNACFERTNFAAAWEDSTTRSIDGLACFRPINPEERGSSTFASSSETEFGVLTDAFSQVFKLSAGGSRDVFVGDRNLNRISCVREFATQPGSCQHRVYAAPSSEPELRRADTADSLKFYLEHAGVAPGETLLAVTNNRYCNRQFLQLAHYLIRHDKALNLDVIGCFPEERITPVERYDPFQYLQILIGVLDWIERFQAERRTA